MICWIKPPNNNYKDNRKDKLIGDKSSDTSFKVKFGNVDIIPVVFCVRYSTNIVLRFYLITLILNKDDDFKKKLIYFRNF